MIYRGERGNGDSRVPIAYMGKFKIAHFLMALGGILRSNEKTSHVKFQANRIIFKGGASELKLTQHFAYCL